MMDGGLSKYNLYFFLVMLEYLRVICMLCVIKGEGDQVCEQRS